MIGAIGAAIVETSKQVAETTLKEAGKGVIKEVGKESAKEIGKKGANITELKEIPNETKEIGKKEPNILELKESVEKLNTRNQGLEGTIHPMTGVSFEKKIVETPDGLIEGTFPKFESDCDVQLPQDLHEATDAKQFDYANEQLKNEIKENPSLKEKFTKEEIEQIENGDTPDGYTWHHSEEKGKMQLVDSEIHSKTGHTGGKSVWGGGNENR